MLDIGAGSGVYSIPFALRSPKVRITAVDLPEVLKVTQRIAERYGIGDRLKTVAGDMAEVNFGVVDPADRSLTLTSFMAFPFVQTAQTSSSLWDFYEAYAPRKHERAVIHALFVEVGLAEEPRS